MNSKFETSLPVSISDEELIEICHELGQDCVRKAELEEEKKNSASNFNEKIKMIQENIDTNSQMASTGTMLRKVSCKSEPDYGSKKVQYIRLDTGEIYDERDMTEEELSHIDMNLYEEQD